MNIINNCHQLLNFVLFEMIKKEKTMKIHQPNDFVPFYAKISLAGVSGSGKTYSALLLAKGLADGGKILVIDTEACRSKVYQNLCDFDVMEFLEPFDPRILYENLKIIESDPKVLDSETIQNGRYLSFTYLVLYEVTNSSF